MLFLCAIMVTFLGIMVAINLEQFLYGLGALIGLAFCIGGGIDYSVKFQSEKSKIKS